MIDLNMEEDLLCMLMIELTVNRKYDPEFEQIESVGLEILPTNSKRWIIHVISVLFCYAFMHVCLMMPCGHLLGKG